METQVCSRCREEQPLEAFGVDRKRPNGHRVWCRTCTREHRRAWVAAHPEAVAEHRRRDAAKLRSDPVRQARQRATAQRWWATHRDEVRAKRKANYYAKHDHYRAKYRGYKRTANLKMYGLTVADYDAMHAAQHGLCAICQRPERRKSHGKVARLSVDHDHTTGLVRALLCGDCNPALGGFDHSITRLQQAITYLKRHH